MSIRGPRLRSVAGGLLSLVLTAVVVGAFGVAVAARIDHLGVSAVLTASMRPTYGPGDAVVVRSIPVQAVRPGMIVEVVPPGHDAPFAHRVISVTGNPAAPTIRTKGDANPAPDDWQVHLGSAQVPQVVGVLPKVGFALTSLSSPHRHTTPFRVALLILTTVTIGFILARPTRPHGRPGAPQPGSHTAHRMTRLTA